jgi:hypothetical protein
MQRKAAPHIMRTCILDSNREQSRDPEMHQAKKGKNWYFGMKAWCKCH